MGGFRKHSAGCRAIIAAGLVSWQNMAHACAVCFGDPDSPQTAALNLAIFTMLGVTGCVLSSIAGAGFVLWRRARSAEGHTVEAEVLLGEAVAHDE